MGSWGNALAVGAALIALSSGARADEAACFNAPVEGQKLQREGKLLRARARFATCSGAECPHEIAEDCTRWMREVEEAAPSIILVAHDAEGRDLQDVVVTIDGESPIRVSARAIALDPGAHKLVFTKGALQQSIDVLLRDAEKNRMVVAEFEIGRRPGSLRRPVPLGTWIFGGLSAASFGVAGVVGTLGLSERGSTCGDKTKGCEEASSVDQKWRVVDVALIVGGAAAIAAAVFYFTRPSLPPRENKAAATSAANLVW